MAIHSFAFKRYTALPGRHSLYPQLTTAHLLYTEARVALAKWSPQPKAMGTGRCRHYRPCLAGASYACSC